MIETYSQLRHCMKVERPLYPNRLYDYLTSSQRVHNWRFIRALRWTEYLRNRGKRNILFMPLYIFSCRLKNRIGSRIGLEIDINTFGEGLVVHHNGSIVVSADATVGRNCQLHGDNCIGNLGSGKRPGSPVIGDNVDIGVGAKIIGPIELADGIRVGANAVVVTSFLEPGITIAGVPAKRVGR